MSTAPSLLTPEKRDSLGRFNPGRPKMFQDIVAFQQAIDAYFTGKDAEGLAIDKPPIYTMEGLARALKCSRQTILQYEQVHDDEAFTDAIKQARQRVAEWTEERLYRAGQHPASPIFSLKNNFGWKDEQSVAVNVAIAVGITAGDEARRGLLPQLVIDQIAPQNATLPPSGTEKVSALSPSQETSIALSPVTPIAVSDAREEAKATPSGGVSPARVA